MSHCRVVCFLLWFGAFTKGLNAQVQTIAVKVGGEAFLNCHLMKSEDVVQVTWQKISPELNLATNSKYFNPRVNPEFRDKVEFKDAGLQNSSIIIRNVKQQDEGCYNCLFNIQHHGAIICETCLQVYELNEPILRVSESSSTAEFIVSCSATGRPAPTVTLTSVQGQNFSPNSTVRVPNTNGTVTVNTTAVLSARHRTSTRVRCSVRLAFGAKTEVFTTIPGFVEERSPSDSNDSQTWIRAPVVLVFTVAAVVIISIIIFLFIKNYMKSLSHSDPEKNEDEEVGKELKDTHGTPQTRTPQTRTPSTKQLLKEENEVTSPTSLRQRESAVKNRPRANPEQKSSAAKKLIMLCQK